VQVAHQRILNRVFCAHCACTVQSPGTTLDRAADEAAKALKHIGALQGGSVGGLAGGTPITVDSSKVMLIQHNTAARYHCYKSVRNYVLVALWHCLWMLLETVFT
jgi:hypothetical protein